MISSTEGRLIIGADVSYGWRNGAKFRKFIFIHIQCSYWYSRIYLFTFNNRIYTSSRNIFIQIYLCISYSRLYLLTFTRCLHSHSTSYIHHIHDRNIHSAFSAHHLRASVSIKHKVDCGLRTTDWVYNTDSGLKRGLSITDWV